MVTYGETVANVHAEKPAALSSYAMKAWAMCLNCISTWLGPCDEEEDASAEARQANSMRWSVWTATGERSEGEARSRSVTSAGGCGARGRRRGHGASRPAA